MTIREDIELLRRFALADHDGVRPCAEREALNAVVRLYSGGIASPEDARFGGDDIADLRIRLADVPMTVEQRGAVAGRLEKLEEAVTHEAPPLVEYTTCAKCGQTFTGDCCLPCDRARERHAEMAIECITNAIGIHDYHDAAKAVLVAWRTMTTLHGIFCTKTAAQLIAVAEGAQAGSADTAYLVGVKNKWHSWRTTTDPRAKARMRVRDILRALRESMDDPLTDALDETIEVLDHLLDSIPF